MSGGTGGHVYPALSFACLARDRGHRVNWLGTQQGLEARAVPAQDIELNTIDIAGIRGKGLLSLKSAPLKVVRAVFQALGIIHRVQPDLVIGFGGYTAGPGGIASKLARVPLVIHEQNAVAGVTNKILRHFADRALCAFDQALFGAEVVGNPVRAELTELLNDEPDAGSEDAQSTRNTANLLVVGGSLGARFLNQSLPEILATVPGELLPKIRHQSGDALFDETLEAYRKAGIEAVVEPFIEDMASAYRWADLAICRAGAMTVSELAVAGLPAILIPFPHAVDDHQTANANVLAQQCAALIYQQHEEDLQRLAHLLAGLLAEPSRLNSMARRVRSLAVPDAAQRILEVCEEVADAA